MLYTRQNCMILNGLGELGLLPVHCFRPMPAERRVFKKKVFSIMSILQLGFICSLLLMLMFEYSEMNKL